MTDSGLRRPTRFDRRTVAWIAVAIAELLRSALPGRVADVWTRSEIDGALVPVLDPVVSDELAGILLAEFPEPPRQVEIVVGFVETLSVPPRVVVAEPLVSQAMFGARQIDDVAALASWLTMTVSELDWFAARGRWSTRASPRLRHYRVRRIPKRGGGFRVIEAPKEQLATVQRKVLDEILAAVPPHPAAHGFVRGRSVESFAAPHSSHDVVVRIDLRHCFEHVTYPRAKAVFSAIGYAPGVAGCLAGLCTTVLAIDDRHGLDPYHAALLRERHLPQGAPTSPALLNLVLRRLDIRLAGYATRRGITYTRYGDDLAFSGNGIDVGRLRWFVDQVAADEGFTVHADKTRVMPDHRRQQLGGLVVNERPRARRSDYDALKALLHNAIRDGAAAQNRDDHTDFRAYVYGRIGWVSTGSPPRRKKLTAMAAEVDWERSN